MTLETLLCIMEEKPKRIVFHTTTTDKTMQFTRCFTRQFPLPNFLLKERVRQYFYNPVIRELEVML